MKNARTEDAGENSERVEVVNQAECIMPDTERKLNSCHTEQLPQDGGKAESVERLASNLASA